MKLLLGLMLLLGMGWTLPAVAAPTAAPAPQEIAAPCPMEHAAAPAQAEKPSTACLTACQSALPALLPVTVTLQLQAPEAFLPRHRAPARVVFKPSLPSQPPSFVNA